MVDDCTQALRLDPNYIKALNRRGTAREQIGGLDNLYLAVCGKYLGLKAWSKSDLFELYIDFTAAAIIDNFATDSTQTSIERVMKRLAQEKATEIMKVCFNQSELLT